MKLLNFFDDNRELQAWHQGFSKKQRTLITGLSGSAKVLAMASAYVNNLGKYVIVTDTQFHVNELVDGLSELIGDTKVFQFFSDDNVYAEFAMASKDRIAYRLEALNFLSDDASTGFLIVPMMALRTILPPVDSYQKKSMVLTKGNEYNLLTLTETLLNAGYEKVQRVMAPGEFSKRGDIVDVYPLDMTNPVRLEFFGDKVDTIRFFSAESQRSLQEIDSLELYPASDMVFSDENFICGAKRLSTMLKNVEDSSSYFDELLSAINNHYFHKDLRKFAEYFYDKTSTLLDYIPKCAQIFIDDFQKVSEMNHKISTDLSDFIFSEKQMGRSLEGQCYLADTIQDIRAAKSATFFSNFQKGLGNLRFDSFYNFNQHTMQQFFGQLDLLYTEVDRFVKQNFTVILAVNTSKFMQQLTETEVNFVQVDSDKLQYNQVNVTALQLSNGFVFLDEKLVIITEAEIFGNIRRKRARRLNITNAERLKNYNELEIGDYVVHRTHGVGKFLGVQTIEIGGLHRDYLTIEYRHGDTISVPIDHLNSLTKYSAGEGKAPKVNRLNDGRWRRTLTSVSREIEDISDDLLKLYADRKAKQGFAFSPDDANQEDFDKNFPYIETPDQLRSINEVKHDMELTRPMDRLLVGDVGFGKTEVAMRGAFKSINDGKQVAVLVPTTVLAEQHYQTMSERFIDFGVNVSVLSRFQTKSQQMEILSKLKRGRIDLIIGTHRLLSKDVDFFDLGLIIIDEEQRFGVKHKERLKELKTQVDALTLTATPIPRTLHMSMLGIRDLSVIETPPTNRYPVQTYVMEFNYGVIRDAVLREISRNGQIFYVYNRVDGIEKKVSQLKELIPEARIAFIHGQMNENQLENTLLDFINANYDMLVTTTIIETGIDIPNANTLFIENADHFGLSQLYQLRGRIGRTYRIAYAYFLYQPEKILSEVSEKRLDAIKGFTELGSGFKIAMRDLSIRGAGNLLGAEQSGYIDSIGFDLYSQLLEEAVQKRLGKMEKKYRTTTKISVGLDAFIPEVYISDERQKIEIYKRIRQIDNQQSYKELEEELVDRFGEYPDEVAYLLEIGLLKCFADNALVKSIEKTSEEIIIKLDKSSNSIYQPQSYFEALAITTLKAKLSEESGLMTFRFKPEKSDIYWLQELIKFLEVLSEIRDKHENVSRETSF